MRTPALILGTILTLVSGPAFAELTKVSTQKEFKQLITGKTLTRPLVRLEVADDGSISGMGATWEVTGDWTWKDGYFCRSLYWGGDELGYNCQEVAVKEGRVRFTSDRGAGDSAEFRIK